MLSTPDVELLKVRGLSAREKDEIRERVAARTPDEALRSTGARASASSTAWSRCRTLCPK